MMPCSFKKKFHKIGNENNLDSDKMAAPQMVDIRQLNPQQLTEVSQRMDQELAVLQGKDILKWDASSRWSFGPDSGRRTPLPNSDILYR